MSAILSRLKNPSHAMAGLLRKFWFLFPNDRLFLEVIYKLEIGTKLNLKSPISFNEKLQWLKLYDRKQEYVKMVDKVTAKQYAASIIGDE